MVNGLYLYGTLLSPYRPQSALHYSHLPIHRHIQTMMMVSYVVATSAPDTDTPTSRQRVKCIAQDHGRLWHKSREAGCVGCCLPHKNPTANFKSVISVFVFALA